MKHDIASPDWKGVAFALTGLIAGVAISSCASLEAYSRRVAKNACRSAGTCTVYDETGRHQEPCWPTQEGTMAYPGDPGWPFEKGVCDTAPADEPEPSWLGWK